MKKIIKIFCFLIPQFPVIIFPFHLENKEIFSLARRGESLKRADITQFFHSTDVSFENDRIVTDPLVLLSAAKLALKYFQENRKINPEIVRPSLFSKKIVSSKTVEATLKFIISTIEQDKKKKLGFRIVNSDFLAKNFKFVKWDGDVKSAQQNNILIHKSPLSLGNLPKGKIRLTKYAIFTFDGDCKKTKKCPCPLYQILDEKFAERERFKYTKQNVLVGALNNFVFKKKIKPLAWLSQENLDDAMMQGTVLIKFPDGKKHLFTVDMSNGISYNKKIKDLKLQRRYWYFKEVKGKNKLKGSILDQGGAVFAGDIFNIGLGKIIMIKYTNPITQKQEARIGVLNDVGGAFANNLYQLDLFSGVFKARDDFRKWIGGIPDAVEAFIVVKA